MSRPGVLTFFALILLSPSAAAPAPAQAEIDAAGAWFDRLSATPAERAPAATLELVFQDVPDAITRGQSWRGTPFQVADRTYAHGLAFNATKTLRVRLGRPAGRFVADVGLENNDDTRRGAERNLGSVRFQVQVDGREVLASGVLRLADAAVHVDVPLAGAAELTLRVDDAGDGRDFDQAVWAAAVLHFEDGSTMKLQDLPVDVAIGGPHVVSFRCDGRPSGPLLDGCERRQEEHPEAAGLRRLVTWRDASSGLETRVTALRYADFPAVEWVGHLRNGGAQDSALLEDIQALDALLPLAGTPVLHWANGAVASFDDFAPRVQPLGEKDRLRLTPGGGKSSSQVLPFFNLARGDGGGGVIVAIGWTGEWAAEFAGTAAGAVHVRAGLARTRLRLHAGEEIRTPRVVLLFYEGDRWRGQNLWRRFVLAHHRPRPGGAADWQAPITCGNWGGTSATVHLDNIRQFTSQSLPIEYYWIDAEWYGTGGWFRAVGDWRVKRDLYPEGFAPLSAELRKTGRKLLLWFEPERVFENTPWFTEHPEWLLQCGADVALLNLGNPEARRYLTDFLSERFREFGLGCYRQDFNIDPLPFWQAADTPDRQGMTEIRYVEGLYALWDELLARHPGLIIDNCASGGKRLDLETLGRATPLWRTDGPRDAIAHQCHSWGLLPWVPLSAASEDRAGDDYEFRSSMCSALALNWWSPGDVPAPPIRADFPWDWARRTLAQYGEMRPFWYGDYYPLTGYSTAPDVWMAYQLDLPERGAGLVVVLRRPESPYTTARLRLHALPADAPYRVRDLDTGRKTDLPGAMLVNEGLEVTLPRKPGSALFIYERIGADAAAAR